MSLWLALMISSSLCCGQAPLPNQPDAPHGAFVYLFSTSTPSMNLDRYFAVASKLADIGLMESLAGTVDADTTALLEDLHAEREGDVQCAKRESLLERTLWSL